MSRSISLPGFRRAALGLAVAATLTLSACGGSNDSGDSAAQAGGDTAAAAPAEATGAPTGGMDGMQGMDHSESAMPDEHDEAAAIPADAEFNAQDVKFAQHMIKHHTQAVEMAEMALKMSSDPEVKALASEIKAAQSPEIKLMTGWLTTWKQEVAMPAHTHAPDALPSGMMTDDEMTKLDAAKGKDFDKLFLEQMIAHHTGAVNLSKTEQKDGKYKDELALAAKIIKAQTTEIAKMKKLV